MIDVLLTPEEIWGIQFKVMADAKKESRLPSTEELDTPVAIAAQRKLLGVLKEKCEDRNHFIHHYSDIQSTEESETHFF